MGKLNRPSCQLSTCRMYIGWDPLEYLVARGVKMKSGRPLEKSAAGAQAGTRSEQIKPEPGCLGFKLGFD